MAACARLQRLPFRLSGLRAFGRPAESGRTVCRQQCRLELCPQPPGCEQKPPAHLRPKLGRHQCDCGSRGRQPGRHTRRRHRIDLLILLRYCQRQIQRQRPAGSQHLQLPPLHRPNQPDSPAADSRNRRPSDSGQTLPNTIRLGRRTETAGTHPKRHTPRSARQIGIRTTAVKFLQPTQRIILRPSENQFQTASFVKTPA